MAQILTMEDVAPFITSLAEQIKKGVYEARTKKGVIMELPEEITIQAMIVTKVQHVAISRTSTRSGSEELGGGNIEQSVLQESVKTDGHGAEQSVSQSAQKSNITENSKSDGITAGKNTQNASGSTIQNQTSNSVGSESTNQTTSQSGAESSSANTNYQYDEKG